MIVNEYGDEILPYKTRGDCVDTYEPEPDQGINFVTVHEVCGGFVDFQKISKTHNALVCRKCNLRVPFPIEAITYRDAAETIFSRIGI